MIPSADGAIPRWGKGRLWLGRRGEDLAAKHLQGQGYTILARNYRTPAGELDIVAQEGGILVFVEVKMRRSLRFGIPQEALTRAKQAHLVQAAQHYLMEREQLEREWRVDLVAVYQERGQPPRIEVVRNAVEVS
jgi:putative endonuclease